MDTPIVLPRPDTPAPTLNARQLDVLRGIADGQTNAQIAKALSLAQVTVKGYVAEVLQNMGANNRTHAVALGFAWKIITVGEHRAAPVPVRAVNA